MRLLCLVSILGSGWLAAGCGDDCSGTTACSADSAGHYQFCNSGKADDCYYQMSDGEKLHCVTCGDCSNALSEVSDWCGAQPDKKTTSNNNNGGTLGSTCTTATCPGGSTYQFCASNTGTNCGYRTGGGTVYACNSCSDCTNATTNVTSWCENGGSTTSSSGSTTSSGGTTSTCSGDAACVASSDCQGCCTSLHAAGAQDYQNVYLACACPLCTTECGGVDQCASNTADCIQCMTNAAQGTCAQALETGCANNADCKAYGECALACN